MTVRLPEFSTLAQVAERLHRSERWIREHLRKHPVGRCAGREILFTDSDVEALMITMTGGSVSPPKPIIQTVYVERPWRYNSPKVSGEGCRVYFIVSGRYVKIGFASNLRRRFAMLQIAHPEELQLVFDLPGGGVEEAALHRKFARHRVRGEWFTYSQEIKDWIADPGRTLQ